MLNERMIEKMTNKGFNRWQKGNMDRLYINARDLGLECDYYNTGNIKSARLNGEHVSNRQADKMLYAKTYVDVKTGALVSGHEWLEEAAEALIAEIEAEIEAEDAGEQEVQEQEVSEQPEGKAQTINKEVMDTVMAEGKVVWEDHSKTADGIDVDCYIVAAYGTSFTMTKHNGEWVYFLNTGV